MFKKFLPIILLALSVSSLHAQTVAYVANGFSGNVSVIDTSTNTIPATIPVGRGPVIVAISPDGTQAYVVNSNGTISVINTSTNAVTATLNLGFFAAFVAVTPDGKTLYISDFSGTVRAVSTATNTVIATIPGNGFALTITPNGARVYTVGFNAVTVIDTASNTVIAGPIPVQAGFFFTVAANIAAGPAGDTVYVVGGNILNAISTATNTVSATVALPGSAAVFGLAITPDGSKVYLPDFLGGSVFIADTATNTLEATSIPTNANPLAIALTPDGAFAYVTLGGAASTSVAVINTTSNAVTATVPVGTGPFGIAIANLNAPFASFPAPTPSNANNPNKLNLSGSLSLGANSPGLDFAHQPMTLTVGGFSLLFPAGTVTQVGNSSPQHFTFNGTLNGLKVNFDLIGNSPNFTYSFAIKGKNAATQRGPNPVTISLAIGSNTGSTTVNF